MIKIAGISDDRLGESVGRIVKLVSEKSGREIELIKISREELLGGDGEAQNSELQKIKSCGAFIFCAGELKKFAPVLKKLGLYAIVKFYDGNGINKLYSVSDLPSKNKESGFRVNPASGREAYDTISYSELEIERVARVAYEICDAHSLGLTLIDRADAYASSALWRKIVTDINEDYPSVPVSALLAGEAAKLKNDGAILSPEMISGILNGYFDLQSGGAHYVAVSGDTPFSAYGIGFDSSPEAESAAADAILKDALGL